MTFFIFSNSPGRDVLVLWDNDGTKNVVSSKMLSFTGRFLKRGSHVTMAWMDVDGRDWTGQVLDIEDTSCSASDSDSSDDVPLARISSKTASMCMF